jgi:hypothetical protein
VEVTLDLVEQRHNPSSDQQDHDPANTTPRLVWLLTMYCPMDLSMEAKPCLRIKQHMKERN